MRTTARNRYPDAAGERAHESGIESVNEPVNEPVKAGLSETGKQILEMVKVNPSVTYDGLAAGTGKSRATVMRGISSLKKKQYLERVGSDKAGSWRILP